jgi:hypothetical protein
VRRHARRSPSTSGRDRALLIVFIHTYARLAEIADLELEGDDAPDIDLDDQFIRSQEGSASPVLFVSIAPRSGV